MMETITDDLNIRQYEYNKDNQIYYIQLKANHNTLSMTIKKDIVIPRKKYSANFTLEELISKSKWFRIFDNMTEALQEMHFSIIDKKYQLKEDTNLLNYHFQIPLNSSDEIILSLKQDDFKEEDLIPDIQLSIEQMTKILASITTKFEVLESNEFNKLYQKEEMKSRGNCLLRKEEESFLKGKIAPLDNDLLDFVFIYKGTIDGDKSDTFHSYCDNQGPTVTIVKTSKGFIFGGYTSKSWDQCGDYKQDENAFVFSINHHKIYPINSNNKAIYCLKTYGPTFGGGHDICILNNYLHTNQNYCYFNGTYEGINYEINGSEQYFKVEELEVYRVIIKTKK